MLFLGEKLGIILLVEVDARPLGFRANFVGESSGKSFRPHRRCESHSFRGFIEVRLSQCIVDLHPQRFKQADPL